MFKRILSKIELKLKSAPILHTVPLTSHDVALLVAQLNRRKETPVCLSVVRDTVGHGQRVGR